MAIKADIYIPPSWISKMVASPSARAIAQRLFLSSVLMSNKSAIRLKFQLKDRKS